MDYTTRLFLFLAFVESIGIGTIADADHIQKPHHQSAVPRYTLRSVKPGEGKVLLRVINGRIGRTVWKYSAPYVACSGWSQDRQALALIVDKPASAPGNANFRLIVWQPNKPVSVYDRLAPLKDLDSVWSLAWSHDKRRIVFCGSWSQGETDMRSGRLYYLTIPPQRNFFVYRPSKNPPIDAAHARSVGLLKTASNGIARAEFIGARRIRCWNWKPPEMQGPRRGIVSMQTAHTMDCP